MELREVGFSLPPGFRFYPSDDELICHYLIKKVANEQISEGTMVEVDLHTREPWELPDVAKLSADEWYFFSYRDRKYATGSRTNRATKSGYWKATGKDRTVSDPERNVIIGMRKTLVFYKGRAPNGSKTDWVMHEFRLETPHSPPKEDWVLCRVFLKRKEEREKETLRNFYCTSTPTIMENLFPYNTDLNKGGSYVYSYQEKDNNLKFNFFHDFSYDLMEEGPKNGNNNESYGILWDQGLNYDHDDVSLKDVGFSR